MRSENLALALTPPALLQYKPSLLMPCGQKGRSYASLSTPVISTISPPRAGATVTSPQFAPAGLPTHAVVVEVWPDEVAELDNGLRLALAQLELVDAGERWVSIPGYNGRYRLSSHGKVVTTRYHSTARTRLLRVLAPLTYPAVALSQAGGVKQMGLNRLVAQHFLPLPTEARFTQVMPRDGNRLNLRAENLQWVDPAEAEDAAVLRRLHPHGEDHPTHRLTADQVAQVRQLVAQGMSCQAIADQFGVSRPAVSQMVHWHTRRYA